MSSISSQTLSQPLQQLYQTLRPGQRSLATWQGGKMAVAAVPGAGKSHSLATAAAIAIARYGLHARRQLIVVTYTRSAAASIKTKIRNCLKDLQLPPHGFRVQTLHGLALNIASFHPELSEINLDKATIISPTLSNRLFKTAVNEWIKQNPRYYQQLLEGVADEGEETERMRRHSVLRTEVLPQLIRTAVGEAKSSGLQPKDLWQVGGEREGYEILAIAAGLYEQYQTLMRSRNLIDYDDMILAAIRVLDHIPIRQIWQNQVFGVFEDEAQDSSPLQEKLISILAADPLNPMAEPNLVRVGDPNQAINSTFTPADPVYFNWFCQSCKAQNQLATMDQAGRSSPIIIEAANYMLDWVNSWTLKQGSDEASAAVELPFRPQHIHPVGADDPQPEANPAPVGGGVEIHTPDDVYQTVELIKQRVVDLFNTHPERNAAILVRENRQGRFIAQQLADLPKQHQIKIYEVSENQRQSQIPEEILRLLQFLHRPHSPDYLKAALSILSSRDLIPAQDFNALATSPEQFLYPSPLTPPPKPKVAKASRYCRNLLRARIELPHYQLIGFLGLTLRYSGSELATVQKLAERINGQNYLNNSSLKTTIETLESIVTSERFEPVEEDSDDAYTRPRQLTIITMHKAKGLDWDYVFIPFLHRDLIPGKLRTPTAAQFLGDFSLAEVARAQIRAIVHNEYQQQTVQIPLPEDAWRAAAQLKQAEEFRLLYVAMTRAKRLLWLSAAQQGPFLWSLFTDNLHQAQSSNCQLQSLQPCPVIPILQQRFK